MKLPIDQLEGIQQRLRQWLDRFGDTGSLVRMSDGSEARTILPWRGTRPITTYQQDLQSAIENAERAQASRPAPPSKPSPPPPKPRLEDRAIEQRRAEIAELRSRVRARIEALRQQARARRAAGENETAIRAELEPALQEGQRHLRWLAERGFDARDQRGGAVNPRAQGAVLMPIPPQLRTYVAPSPTPAIAPAHRPLPESTHAQERQAQAPSEALLTQEPPSALPTAEAPLAEEKGSIKTIADFVKKTLATGASRVKRKLMDVYSFATVSPERAKIIADSIKEKLGVTVDVTGFQHVMDEDSIRKVFKDHGNAKEEALRGQIAVTALDFDLVPRIINDGEIIEAGKTKTGLPAVTYRAKIGDVYYYVEEVRNGRGQLALRTLYKRSGRSAQPEGSSKPLPEAIPPSPVQSNSSIPPSTEKSSTVQRENPAPISEADQAAQDQASARKEAADHVGKDFSQTGSDRPADAAMAQEQAAAALAQSRREGQITAIQDQNEQRFSAPSPSTPASLIATADEARAALAPTDSARPSDVAMAEGRKDLPAGEKPERFILPESPGVAKERASRLSAAIRAGETRLRSKVDALGEPLSRASLDRVSASVKNARAELDALQAAFPKLREQRFAIAAPLGQTPGLFEKAPVVITELTGQEFGPGLKKEALAQAAEALLRKLQIGPPLVNEDTGWELVVGKQDRRKMGNNADQSVASSQTVAKLGEVVRHAVLADSHADTKQNPEVSAIHRLYAPVRIQGILYRVKLTVKDYSDRYGRRNLHALEAIEIQNAPSPGILPALTPDQKARQQAQPTTIERTLSIARLLQGATRDSDGQPFAPDSRFAAASTPASLTASLKALADDATVRALIERGRLHVVARQAEMPAHARIRPGQRVAGWVDPRTGAAWLVAENVAPEDVQGYLRHEIGVHQTRLGLERPPSAALNLLHAVTRLVGARGLLGDSSFDDVLNQMDRLRATSKAVQTAFQEAESAAQALDQGAHLQREEALAYLIQNQPQLPLARRFLAAIRAALYRMGFKVSLTEADLRALAVSALRGAARTPLGGRESGLTEAFSQSPEDQEAARQYAEVVVRYTNPDGTKKEGWLKAPNGEPTKLTERQWVQARTESFKQWFGDWEIAAHQQVIDALPTIPVDFPLTATLPLVEARHQALAEAKRRFALDRQPRKVTAPNGDDIWIAMSGLKESISKHAGIQKMRILPVLDRLIENSHFVLTAPDAKAEQRTSTNVRGYRYYVANAMLDGKPYYVKLAVREIEDSGIKRRFYDHELSEVSEAAGESGTTAKTAGHPPATASLDHIVHHGWQKFNGDASQVVDANGEPRVAYHGTARDFATFDARKVGSNYKADKKGFFFALDPDEAWTAAGDAAEKRGAQGELILPTFLSLRRPLDVDASKFYGSASGYLDHHKSSLLNLVKERKADGLIVRGKTPVDVVFVAFSPTQIKSALGNTGTFSPANADIRYARSASAPPSSTADELLARVQAGAVTELTPEEWAQVQQVFLGSAVESIPPTGTNAPTFKDWFGASKIKKKDGSPLVMYHGTTADFTTFDAAKSGQSTTHPTAALGFFFTNDRAHAAATRRVCLKLERNLFELRLAAAQFPRNAERRATPQALGLFHDVRPPAE